jgi:uncharacterized iron-regulated membrane protein
VASGRTWLWWHSWIGVSTGLMLFVICWSGTVAVLSHEIDWLLDPALRVRPSASPPRWAGVVAAAQRAVPGQKVTTLTLPAGPRDAAQLWAEDAHGVVTRLYVDPATARVQGARSYFNVQRFFRSFHMNLFFNAGPWGYLVVCAFALPLLASMVTALVFYKRWWQRLLALKFDRGVRIFVSDLHKTGGLWGLWFIAVMALTGFWYFIEAAGVVSAYPQTPVFAPQPRTAAGLPLDEVLVRARAHWPALEVRNITLPGGCYGDVIELEGQAGDLLVRDRANKLFLDPTSGEALARHRAAELSLAARWVDTADPLHFGDFAGLGAKLVWFAFGLALSALSLSGAYLQVQRLRRKHAGLHRRPAVIAAYAVSAVLLAASAAGGWTEIRQYGPELDGARQWPLVPLPVIVFIGGWVMVTLGVLAAWVRSIR